MIILIKCYNPRINERIKLITDTASSITHQEADRLGIGLNPFYINFDSGDCFTDFSLPPSELYLRQKTDHAKTATPNTEDLIQTYNNYYQQGFREFINVCISSSLSGAFQNANFVSNDEEFLAKHPGITIQNIDSASLCVGQGLTVDFAWKLINQGEPIEKIVEKLNQIKNNTVLYASGNSQTLEFARTSGRVEGIQKVITSMVSMFKLIPILSNKDGKIKPSGTARTEKIGRIDIIEMLSREINNRNCLPSGIGISYTQDENIGQELIDLLYSKLPELRQVKLVGPKEAGSVLATHTGPGVSVLAANWY